LAISTTPKKNNMDVPKSIVEWLGCAGFMVMFVYYAQEIYTKMRGQSPEPPNGELSQAIANLKERVTSQESRSASVEKLSELTERVSILERRWTKEQSLLSAQNEERASKLHRRVDEILAAVSMQTGKLDMLTTNVSQIRADLSSHLNKESND
jgi:hypothetical protein